MEKTDRLLTETTLAEVVGLHNRILEAESADRRDSGRPGFRAFTPRGQGGAVWHTRRSLTRLSAVYAMIFIVLIAINFMIIGSLKREPVDGLQTYLTIGHLTGAAPGTLSSAVNEVLPWQE
jgi:hypothetical protein